MEMVVNVQALRTIMTKASVSFSRSYEYGMVTSWLSMLVLVSDFKDSILEARSLRDFIIKISLK
jgi:hypothetical protein